MNHIEFDAKRQRNIEFLVLVIGTLYAAGLLALRAGEGLGSWILAAVAVMIALAWTFYLISYRTFRFRACTTYLMIQLAMLLYMLRTEAVQRSFASMLALTVVIVFYALPELVWITLAAYTFELAYHFLVTGQLRFTGTSADVHLLIQLLSVYMVQFAVYYAICRQAEASQEQDERIEDLKDAERSKDDFLANVSHEIRTPINTICGMSETVLREQIPEHLREEVFNIQNAGQNLLSLVSDILDFSELQSDNVELVEEEYNIASLANDIVSLSVAKRDEKEIELIMDMDAALPCGLVGDEQKIRRVVMNLVSNAIKFTDDGGVIIVISFRREDYGVNLTVTVKDTGIGMKKEHLEKIFTSFSQIDSKRNRREGGVGLGLAISRAIVMKMGGFISVQSEYGRGSQIQFTVPQKVVNWEPVASVKNPGACNAAIYMDMEQFAVTEIRDEYTRVISRIAKQSGVSCCICQNLPELKRRAQREYLTHVFIGVMEYQEDEAFFDELADHAKVMVVLDHYDEDKVTNEKLLRIYKPLFILPVIMALNGEQTAWGVDLNRLHRGKFRAPGAKLLAVDDNRMNLKVLESLLKPYELRLVCVTSGAEALEAIESRDYDFVFMDHMMPEMDGIETLKRIREKQGSYFRTVPVVALTANSVSGMREMFLGEGFDGFLSKPVELSAMERVLRRFIPRYKIVDIPEDGAGVQEPAAPGTEESAERGKGVDAAAVSASNVTSDSSPQAVQGSPVPASGGTGGQQRGNVQAEKAPGELELQDLDIQKGLLYCGGMNGYIEVLKLHCADGESNRQKIEELYESRNWKEYCIYVHALKSSMLSIGAVQLSEMAKKLEAAAKAEDSGYILAEHGNTMQEYQRVLDILKASPQIGGADGASKERAEETRNMREQPKAGRTVREQPGAGAEAEALLLAQVNLTERTEAARKTDRKQGFVSEDKEQPDAAAQEGTPEIDMEEFERLLAQFEDAVYTLDRETMEPIAERFAACAYRGHSMDEVMSGVRRKIDMEDYMSALDTILKMKEKWSKS